MVFIVSKKNTQNGLLVVITDYEILGKIFTEGKKQLELTNKFYLGEEKKEKEVCDIIKSAYILHLTGINSVSLGLKIKLIEKNRIITVQGVPHAEVLLER